MLGVSRVVLCRLVVRHPAARSQLIICQSRPAAARRQSRGVRSRAASPCTMSVSSCARRQSRRAEWPRREESRVVASCVIASRVVSSNCIDAAFRTIIECFSFFQGSRRVMSYYLVFFFSRTVLTRLFVLY